MKRALVLLALFVACRGERAVVDQKAPPKVTETVVAEPANVANANVENVIPLVAPVAKRCEVSTSPLQLTIELSESPKELQVGMRVRDLDGDEVATVSKPANGATVITLKMDKKLEPGKYRVEGVWGGNVACEQDVTVKPSS